MLVVDRDNHRIQSFAADGTWIREWGDRGAFPGLLSAPSSIDVVDGLVYVSEELNHRVSVFGPGGRFLYQWGMHPVVPRQGEGAIHYPRSVDVSADGDRALVAEPFERRVQLFEPFEGGVAEARSQPMPSKESILSHFGRFLAADGDLLAMWEPESGSVVVFDLSGETGINITVFSNHGDGWDDIGRLGALHVDADVQEVIISDPVNDRLQRWRLDRGDEDYIKYDPFMARLVSATDLARTRAGLDRIDPDRNWLTPRIEAFGRARADGAPLLAADGANGVVIALDRELDPIAIVADCVRPLALVPADRGVYLVETDGSIARISDDEVTPVLEPTGWLMGGVAYLPGAEGPGRIFCSAVEDDTLQARTLVADAFASAPDAEWGGTGDADGQLHAPSGLGIVDGNRIVVVDQGNHRAQIFSPDGSWLSTFSLSSGYNTPRRRAAEEPQPLEEDSP